ncbi:MAG: hypothetical protein JSW66_15705 [Phycisphaerales bacterium]|nr:MAG: hypothetical protein JSW66_15705 [Phycisphaerales bacterium]
MRRVLRITLGVVLMILGVLALLTPLTPGSWLALIGLELLGIRLVFQRKFLSLLPKKYRHKAKNLLTRELKKRQKR